MSRTVVEWPSGQMTGEAWPCVVPVPAGGADLMTPIPLRLNGMPAMAVLFHGDGRPGQADARGVALVEGPGGVPYGYLARRDGDRIKVLEYPRAKPWLLGMVLGCAWLDGTLRGMDDGTASGVRCHTGDARPDPTCALTAAIRAALPRSGFATTFIDTLECLAVVDVPVRLRGTAFPFLCGDDPRDVACRSWAMANPTLATVGGSRYAKRVWGGRGLSSAMGRDGITGAKARVLSLPAWDPKSLRPRADMGMRHDRYVEALRRLVGAVPVDWLPTERESAIAFAAVADILPDPSGKFLDARTMVAPSKGNWPDFARRCLDAGGLALLGGKGWESSDPYISDPAMHMAAAVVAPVMHAFGGGRTDDAPRLAASLLYRDKGLPEIIATARTWHEGLERLRGALPRDRHPDAWPALLPDATVDGITLTCLTTEAGLEDEGRTGPDADGIDGLEHCVAFYRARAALGECHVVSLRGHGTDGRPVRLATAELRQWPDGRVRVAQLRGSRNGPAPEGCREAVEAYVAGPVTYLPPRSPVPKGRIHEACGYDPDDRDLVRDACRAYRAFLPRGLREPEKLAEWCARAVGGRTRGRP